MRVVAAPLAALPRTAAIATTHSQRRKLLAAGASVAWLSYAALSGLGVSELVGATLVKVMSFVRPENALSTMDRSFCVGEALFKFGEFEMAGVAIRPPTGGISRDFARTRVEICGVATRAIRRAMVLGEADDFFLVATKGWDPSLRFRVEFPRQIQKISLFAA